MREGLGIRPLWSVKLALGVLTPGLLALMPPGCSLFREPPSADATPSPVVISLSAAEVARAMQEDQFYFLWSSLTA